MPAIASINSPTTIQELWLPWAASVAWRTFLENVHVAEESFLQSPSWLGDEAKGLLPESIVDTLEKFGRNEACCALVLRNCPVDRLLPPTPYTGRLPPNCVPVSATVNLTLYQLLQLHPIVYQGENDGILFRHVVPTHGDTESKSSHGSRERFGYHVDNPDLPLVCEPIDELSGCPEYLSLFGMRCDLSVVTTIVPIHNVIERLRPDILETLRSPKFVIRRPASFGTGKETEHLPLLVADETGHWYCRFDNENTRGMDPAASSAIIELQRILQSSGLELNLLLRAGDFLIMKNQNVLHARNGFAPRYDGTDRWLMRLFGMSQRTRVRSAPGARPFEVAA